MSHLLSVTCATETAVRGEDGTPLGCSLTTFSSSLRLLKELRVEDDLSGKGFRYLCQCRPRLRIYNQKSL